MSSATSSPESEAFSGAFSTERSMVNESVALGSSGSSSIVKSNAAEKSGAMAPLDVASLTPPWANAVNASLCKAVNNPVVPFGNRSAVTEKFVPSALVMSIVLLAVVDNLISKSDSEALRCNAATSSSIVVVESSRDPFCVRFVEVELISGLSAEIFS